MTYRELLKKCKEEPGCIRTKEQADLDSMIRYISWVEKANSEPENNQKN